MRPRRQRQQRRRPRKPQQRGWPRGGRRRPVRRPCRPRDPRQPWAPRGPTRRALRGRWPSGSGSTPRPQADSARSQARSDLQRGSSFHGLQRGLCSQLCDHHVGQSRDDLAERAQQGGMQRARSVCIHLEVALHNDALLCFQVWLRCLGRRSVSALATCREVGACNTPRKAECNVFLVQRQRSRGAVIDLPARHQHADVCQESQEPLLLRSAHLGPKAAAEDRVAEKKGQAQRA
mmetsp:Transcript_38520/g.123812  ORF Transcript_38520/g.123812 Transcript_38520/m.123812 type:complete len:234 (+) Transcript_38520:170-871(+)